MAGMRTTLAALLILVAGTAFAGEDAWTLHTEVSPLDDSTTVILWKASETLHKNAAGASRFATLGIRCQEDYVNVILDFRTVLNPDANEIQYRIDEAPAVTETWAATSNYQMLLSKDPINLLRQLSDAKQLFVRVRTITADRIDTTFDLTGLRELLPNIIAACPQRFN
jgi:hypothetical protein